MRVGIPIRMTKRKHERHDEVEDDDDEEEE
jgi:hypothetical protein